MSGVFITFEGGEGTGKSTQIAALARRLQSAGVVVRLLREPGGTAAGEAIRRILLDPDHDGLSARAELLLYEAARAQLVAEVIRPALEAGEVVICDRFFDSTTAYQGYARGLDLAEVRELHATATGGLSPDRTIVLDIDPAAGLARATAHGADRLEREDIEFHKRVREGFLAIAAAEPQRVRVIDASGTIEDVAARIAAALRDVPAVRVALGESS
ncbi:MAG: dTMP kinase [Coriobacteriia bacterium]|nr:dTMP kinase [Coriobacteriia bacterium]